MPNIFDNIIPGRSFGLDPVGERVAVDRTTCCEDLDTQAGERCPHGS